MGIILAVAGFSRMDYRSLDICLFYSSFGSPDGDYFGSAFIGQMACHVIWGIMGNRWIDFRIKHALSRRCDGTINRSWLLCSIRNADSADIYARKPAYTHCY